MAIVRVQHNEAVSNAVAFGSNNTAGNLLVALIECAAAITGVTDTAGNTWTKAVGSAAFNPTEIWYVANCTSGANTVTAANSFGSSFCHIGVAEYSGCDTSTPLDKTSGAGNSIGNPDSGTTATTTQADEVLLGIISNDGTRTTTWDAGWTEYYDDTGGGAGRSATMAEQIVAATGTYKASGVLSGAADWDAVIATFKAVTGSPPMGAAVWLLTV